MTGQGYVLRVFMDGYTGRIVDPTEPELDGVVVRKVYGDYAGEIVSYCDLHGRYDCTLCDECGHAADAHLWAPAEADAVAQFIYANATCWAENICRDCDPALHNDALVRGLGQASA